MWWWYVIAKKSESNRDLGERSGGGAFDVDGDFNNNNKKKTQYDD